MGSLILVPQAELYFLSQAYRLGQPSTVAPFEYIFVPLSVMWGYVFWKDILELHSMIGMVLIIGSGAAGLSLALELAEHATVLILSKATWLPNQALLKF